jgi:hypothetical protein
MQDMLSKIKSNGEGRHIRKAQQKAIGADLRVCSRKVVQQSEQEESVK